MNAYNAVVGYLHIMTDMHTIHNEVFVTNGRSMVCI